MGLSAGCWALGRCHRKPEWRYSSVIECLPSMHEALDSILSFR